MLRGNWLQSASTWTDFVIRWTGECMASMVVFHLVRLNVCQGAAVSFLTVAPETASEPYWA